MAFIALSLYPGEEALFPSLHISLGDFPKVASHPSEDLSVEQAGGKTPQSLKASDFQDIPIPVHTWSHTNRQGIRQIDQPPAAFPTWQF